MAYHASDRAISQHLLAREFHAAYASGRGECNATMLIVCTPWTALPLTAQSGRHADVTP
jgi:hypothetical protein